MYTVADPLPGVSHFSQAMLWSQFHKKKHLGYPAGTLEKGHTLFGVLAPLMLASHRAWPSQTIPPNAFLWKLERIQTPFCLLGW